MSGLGRYDEVRSPKEIHTKSVLFDKCHISRLFSNFFGKVKMFGSCGKKKKKKYTIFSLLTITILLNFA